jgi:hypothetical protein
MALLLSHFSLLTPPSSLIYHLKLNKIMKTLDREIVKIVAENLLIENGKTTTLEVKNKLRAKNYFALQADISVLLADISQEEGWQYEDNGVYRTYRFENDLKTLLFGLQFSAN